MVTFFVTFSILLPNILIAQITDNTSIPPGPSSGGGDTIDDPVPAPIDGGISLLLAAGIGYGVKKHRENRKIKTVQFE